MAARTTILALLLVILASATVIIILSGPSGATTWRVDSDETLYAAQRNLTDGDTVILAVPPNGYYELWFFVNRSVTVRAETMEPIFMRGFRINSPAVLLTDLNLQLYGGGLVVLDAENVSIVNVSYEFYPEYGLGPAVMVLDSPACKMVNCTVRLTEGTALVIDGASSLSMEGSTLASGGDRCVEVVNGSRFMAFGSSISAPHGFSLAASGGTASVLDGCYLVGGTIRGTSDDAILVTNRTSSPPSGDMPPRLTSPIGGGGYIVLSNRSHQWGTPPPDSLQGVTIEDHFVDEWPLLDFKVAFCSEGQTEAFEYRTWYHTLFISGFHPLHDVIVLQVGARDWLGQTTLSDRFEVSLNRTDDEPYVYATGFLGSDTSLPPNPLNLTINASDDVRVERLFYATGIWEERDHLEWTEVPITVGPAVSTNLTVWLPKDFDRSWEVFLRASDGAHEGCNTVHLTWPATEWDASNMLGRAYPWQLVFALGIALTALGAGLLLIQLVLRWRDRSGKKKDDIRYLRGFHRGISYVLGFLLVTGAIVIAWSVPRLDRSYTSAPGWTSWLLPLGGWFVGAWILVATSIRWRAIRDIRSRATSMDAAVWSIIGITIIVVGSAAIAFSSGTAALLSLICLYPCLIMIGHAMSYHRPPVGEDPLGRVVLESAARAVVTVKDGFTTRPFTSSVRFPFTADGFKGEVVTFARFLVDNRLLLRFTMEGDSALLTLPPRPSPWSPIVDILAPRRAIDVRLGSDGSCLVTMPKEVYDEFSKPVSYHELCEGVGRLLEGMYEDFRSQEPTKALMRLYPKTSLTSLFLILAAMSTMLALTLMAHGALAGEHHVDPSEPYGIQSAINRSLPGDTIVVGPGEFFGPLVIDRPITLRGESGIFGTSLKVPDGPSGIGYPWIPYLGNPGIIIRSSNVSIVGISIYGTTTGVLIWRAKDVALDGLRIWDAQSAYAPEGRRPIDGFGICIIESDGISITSTSISRCYRSSLVAPYAIDDSGLYYQDRDFWGGVFARSATNVTVQWCSFEDNGHPQLRAENCSEMRVVECTFSDEHSAMMLQFSDCRGVTVTNSSFKWVEDSEGPSLICSGGDTVHVIGAFWGYANGTPSPPLTEGDVLRTDDRPSDYLVESYPRVLKELPGEFHVNESERRLLFNASEYFFDPFQPRYYLRSLPNTSRPYNISLNDHGEPLAVGALHTTGTFQVLLTVDDLLEREWNRTIVIVVDPVYTPPSLKPFDEGNLTLPEADWMMLILYYAFSGKGGGPLPRTVDGDVYKWSFGGRVYTETPDLAVEYRIDRGPWQRATISNPVISPSYSVHNWRFYHNFTRERDDGRPRAIEVRATDGLGNSSQVYSFTVECLFTARPDDGIQMPYIVPVVVLWAVASAGVFVALTRGTTGSDVDWKALYRHAGVRVWSPRSRDPGRKGPAGDK